MQHHYQEEADLELEILRRICGDVDRLTVHREDRRRHPGNEDEYHMRQKSAEEQTKGRGAQGASNQECDRRRESESRERQQYARDREEQIEFQQSEPYPSPMSEPDPPTQPEPSSRGGAKAKTKVTLEDYRSRQLQKESPIEKDKCDQESERLLDERESIEVKKVEQARLHEIEIRQAEVAQIKHEWEQLCLEQERVQKEQEANAALLASQAQQVPVALGSHTPCYDEHGQELDYHDDVPAATNSQECRSWDKYFRQQGDASEVQIADSVDEEHRLLLGPTMTSTISEEAVLLREDEMPTVDMRQFLAGLETLTPVMLSELSMRIEHLRQLAAPLAPTKSTQKESPPAPPPGLPATPTVINPMEQALLRVMSKLGTSPAHQHTPTCPPSAEETERAAALLVEQMAKAPGTPFQKQKHD